VAFLSVAALVVFQGIARPAAAPQSPSAVGSPLESQVKAAYVLNFINLTEWPAAALGPASAPFRVCLAGTSQLRTALEDTVKGESVHGHPVVVDRLTSEAAPMCQVIFVPASDAAQVPDLMRAVGPAAVLFIGETDAFLRAGGAVRFVVDQGHVRFDVNRRSAEQRGLTLSSRLLRVARSVRQ
jgi:hypothetical protein